jgi:transposase InsO family protein
MIQKMIITAFSTLGLQGQGNTVSSSWIIDSRASNHMTGSSDLLCNLREYSGTQNIQIANGSNLPITAIGDIGPSFPHVFISLELFANLISIGQMVDNNWDVHLSRNGCLVQDQVSGKVIARGPKVGRLFLLQFTIPRALSLASVIVDNKIADWHKRLGHPNNVILSNLMKRGFLGHKDKGSTHSLSFDCSTCKLGKRKTLPFPAFGSRANTCFEIIHSDVWGIAPVISHGQYKYFVTFIDDYSRFTWIYFLRIKAEVFNAFQTFLAYIETQFSTCIKVFRSDNGGEYISHKFQALLQQKGIISQRSCPYTPQQNGLAERKNHHLLDMVRTLLLESSVPPKFWVEALSTAVYCPLNN